MTKTSKETYTKVHVNLDGELKAKLEIMAAEKTKSIGVQISESDVVRMALRDYLAGVML